MNINQMININLKRQSYKVKVLKVFEMFENGNGLIKAEFDNGQIMNIGIQKIPKEITNEQ